MNGAAPVLAGDFAPFTTSGPPRSVPTSSAPLEPIRIHEIRSPSSCIRTTKTRSVSVSTSHSNCADDDVVGVVDSRRANSTIRTCDQPKSAGTVDAEQRRRNSGCSGEPLNRGHAKPSDSSRSAPHDDIPDPCPDQRSQRSRAIGRVRDMAGDEGRSGEVLETRARLEPTQRARIVRDGHGGAIPSDRDNGRIHTQPRDLQASER